MAPNLRFLLALLAVLSVLALAVLATSAPAMAQAPAFDGQRAMELLAAQVEMGPRNPGSEGHAACKDWLLAFLRERADTVLPHAFELDDPYGEGKLGLTNIKASFAAERTRRVALAAHWDTRPRADMEPAGAVETPILGANDGASGVAVLLAIAELLADHPAPVGVDILLFDGEDYGRTGDPQYYLLGSRRFVADFPDYAPEAVILIDMIGGKGLTVPMELYGFQYAPQLTRTVFERAARLGLPAFLPEPGTAVLDDHVPFLERGIPAVDLIDFQYRAWHTLADDLEACDASSLEQVGRLLLALLFEDFAG